jgi:hypothetical protein
MPRLGRNLALPWASPLKSCSLYRSRALIMAGEKRRIGASSFGHPPLHSYAETLLLPRVEWYARRHAILEDLAGH